MRLRPHSRYLPTDATLSGFSSIAPAHWRTAEKLRNEATLETAQQNWRVHWTIPSAICLYHAALDCFINEEIALAVALTEGTLAPGGRTIQDNTLNAKKLNAFFAIFGLTGKQTPEVFSRTLLFIDLRDRLYHHAPEMRDVREYPDPVIAALNDAGIEPVNTSWTAQCSDVRLAKWASLAVSSFIDDWCQARGIPSRMQLPGWAPEGSETIAPE
jgi:hypothetical protein